jgi:hypothetical protein
MSTTWTVENAFYVAAIVNGLFLIGFYFLFLKNEVKEGK